MADKVEVDLAGLGVVADRGVVLGDGAAVGGPVEAADVLAGEDQPAGLVGEEELHMVVEALRAQGGEFESVLLEGVELGSAEGDAPHPGG